MRKISVSVDKLGRVTADSELLGYSGEHNAVVLAVDFSSGRNEGFMSAEYCRVVIEGLYSDEIYVTDGGFEYTVPGECMLPPKVHCQIVGYKTDNGEPTVIVKTEVFGFSVEHSEIPIEAVGGDAGVFERTLEKCSALTKTAVASADSAKASCEEASASAQTATEAMRSALNSATVAKKSAETAVSAAEVLSATAINMKDVSNALKGTASGKVVAIKDVSPLPHDVTVKVSGGDTEGGEVLTKTETLSTKDAAVLLDTPASSVRVVVSGGAYCVGGLVPTVSGDDLTASGIREQLALWPTWSYGEAPGVYDLEYTISGDTLSWSGVKYYASDSSMNEAVSGSVELSTPGQMITGFCQVYDLSEDNPYAESPEWDELNMTVEVYEGLSDTAVKVYGKNLFKPTSARQIGGVVPDKFSVQEDGSVKIVGGAGVSINYALNPNPTLPAGTYTFKGTNTDKFIYYVFTLKNGVQTGWYNGTFTLNEGDTIQYLQVRSARNYTGAFDDVINVQIEVGSVATDYEPYREPVTYTPNSDGEISIASVYPSMTLIPDNKDVTLSVEYNRDINKAFAELQAALISMGGNV
ncbi:MAG: hypothetical protein IJA41_02495 [Clostridia bacterium]|nr:hypothetical protein [Clostridia bacterium]